jgi:hypothetical protein
METQYITKIEKDIHEFISKYGVDELSNWLKQYSKEISPTDYNKYRRIQSIVCEVYQIPIADINSTNSTNQDTKLKPKHVAKLQNCTQRTISNHLSDCKYRIKNPKGFGKFISSYTLTIEKLQTHGN